MKIATDSANTGRSGLSAPVKSYLWIVAIGALVLAMLISGCRESGSPSPTASSRGSSTRSPETATSHRSTPESADTAATATAAADLVIVNGTIIDGTGADPIRDGVLIVAGGRVTAVGPASGIPVPPEARLLDANGGTILPGFVNAHVHDGYDASNLEGWAQGGVTTVRELGSSRSRQALFAIRDERRAQPKYARLVAAGSFVSVPGGYPEVPWGAKALTVTSADEARQKTAQLLDDGADVIKIMMGTRW